MGAAPSPYLVPGTEAIPGPADVWVIARGGQRQAIALSSDLALWLADGWALVGRPPAGVNIQTWTPRGVEASPYPASAPPPGLLPMFSTCEDVERWWRSFIQNTEDAIKSGVAFVTPLTASVFKRHYEAERSRLACTASPVTALEIIGVQERVDPTDWRLGKLLAPLGFDADFFKKAGIAGVIVGVLALVIITSRR